LKELSTKLHCRILPKALHSGFGWEGREPGGEEEREKDDINKRGTEGKIGPNLTLRECERAGEGRVTSEGG
jgi:hypothetical protein